MAIRKYGNMPLSAHFCGKFPTNIRPNTTKKTSTKPV
jgi:hypothetical protein